jgi:hypothetical protein
LKQYLKVLPFVAIGLGVVAIAVTLVMYVQWGAHKELIGNIQKVRTLPLDENSSAAIIDFRFRNAADYPWDVSDVLVSMVGPSGKVEEGAVISDRDTANLFQYFTRQLGEKYNPTLLIRTRVKPRESMDRMVAARFEVPEKVLQQRKNLAIRIREIDGATSDISEKPLQ